MNRKKIPLLLMLVAGAITCIINLIHNYSILVQLTSLLIVMVVFCFLGSILKWTLDYFENQNEAARMEKEAAAEAEAENEEEGVKTE